jgi:hypothetical protein
MTSNTLYIIAGNMEEYLDWAYKSNAKYPTHNFYYVMDSTNLRNTHNPDGLFIGTWYDRKDAWEMIQMLVEVCPDPQKQRKFSEILQIYLQKKNR